MSKEMSKEFSGKVEGEMVESSVSKVGEVPRRKRGVGGWQLGVGVTRLAVLIILASLLTLCASHGTLKLKKNLEVRSVFRNGGFIPKKYTLEGQDISPPLELVNLSPKARSIAIVVIDPDAPGGRFVHWMIWDIPPVKYIPPGIPRGRVINRPFHAYQGKNGFGRYGYDGPYPPKGEVHRYVFKVYVLDTVLKLKNANLDELINAMRGHVIQYGEIVGLYGR